MLSTIKLGDTVKCLNCGNAIKLTNETLGIDTSSEFIRCSECQKSYDVQVYHMYGQLMENY